MIPFYNSIKSIHFIGQTIPVYNGNTLNFNNFSGNGSNKSLYINYYADENSKTIEEYVFLTGAGKDDNGERWEKLSNIKAKKIIGDAIPYGFKWPIYKNGAIYDDWGNGKQNNFPIVSRWDTDGTGSIQFRQKGDVLNMEIDGTIYINEGKKEVATTEAVSNIRNKLNSLETKVEGLGFKEGSFSLHLEKWTEWTDGSNIFQNGLYKIGKMVYLRLYSTKHELTAEDKKRIEGGGYVNGAYIEPLTLALPPDTSFYPYEDEGNLGTWITVYFESAIAVEATKEVVTGACVLLKWNSEAGNFYHVKSTISNLIEGAEYYITICAGWSTGKIP